MTYMASWPLLRELPEGKYFPLFTKPSLVGIPGTALEMNARTNHLYRIGEACARALWAQGASLALTYRNNEFKAHALMEELNVGTEPLDDGKYCFPFQVDMTSEDDIYNLFTSIYHTFGRYPDILISNAGHGKRIPDIADITLAEFDHTLSVNLRASFILAKHLIPPMAANHWGRIVFVSSIAAHGGGVNGCHYAASKAGLTGLMKSLANKHAKDGITVNDVAPAMIGDTGMIPDEESVKGTPGDVRNIPVGRLGTPEEVANVVVMFCRTGYMTGQSVLLSGGLK
jgi:3-oxoacyl-[acyl-carrier protein] reductase